MNKKLIIFLVLAISLLLSTQVAYAALDSTVFSSIRGGRLMYGQVVEIGSDQFTIENSRGGLFTFLVDQTTRYYSREIEDPTFANFIVGQKVAVTSRWAISGLPDCLPSPAGFLPRRSIRRVRHRAGLCD